VTRLYDPFDTYVFLQGATSATPTRPEDPGAAAAREWLLRAVLDHPGGQRRSPTSRARRLYTRSLLIVIFEGDGDDPQAEALARATPSAPTRRGARRGRGPVRSAGSCGATR
jgi:hypothetical protein